VAYNNATTAIPMKRPIARVRIFALPLRLWLHRFGFTLLLACALALLIIGRTQPVLMEQLRTRIIDFTAPVITALAQPVATVNHVTTTIGSYFALQGANETLRAENTRLLHWQHAAQALQSENDQLRALLNFKTEPGHSFITARVIGDSGGPFARSMLITAGAFDGVKKGMAAMSDAGLIGRVTEVGNWSARILLLTDINSRIPVLMADGGTRGILAGDNSGAPLLLHLPKDFVPEVGAQLLTSGHGGVFPPQLPVGVVASAVHGEVRVTPLADLTQVNYVRLVDFGLAGGSINTLLPDAADDTPAKNGR
jgi:rod shape-determining protein MreC